MRLTKNNKLPVIFSVGLIESLGFTLYLIAVNKYLIFTSSLLMFFYMAVYLWLIDKIAKDKDSIGMLLVYAFACGLGNYIAMAMHLIK
jgi:uncharacterized protein YebE (UPF0316 family)